jgi:hypothetical protein
MFDAALDGGDMMNEKVSRRAGIGFALIEVGHASSVFSACDAGSVNRCGLFNTTRVTASKSLS